jgi:hypothetical protein
MTAPEVHLMFGELAPSHVASMLCNIGTAGGSNAAAHEYLTSQQWLLT